MAHGNIGVANGILYQILAGNGWFRTCGAKRSPRRGKYFPEQFVEEINHNDADNQSYYHLSYFTPNDFSDDGSRRAAVCSSSGLCRIVKFHTTSIGQTIHKTADGDAEDGMDQI